VATRRKEEGVRVLADVLGARVRARRGDLGISQAKLAELMRRARGHRWTHGTVSRIETGEAEPTLSELVSLMLLLESNFESLTDPVIAGNQPVDLGFSEVLDAEFVRSLLAGEERFFYSESRGWVHVRIDRVDREIEEIQFGEIQFGEGE
jgi:transcriptional regulator with XRE-family HTH domain